jgi:hypothetical protein
MSGTLTSSHRRTGDGRFGKSSGVEDAEPNAVS